ncbi:MAG: FkbM family methyltransferase, partial [Desulfobacterales bacterium]|nr:FkbM family methyltransferase [Desulfobacterales bacterium]
VGVMVDVGAHYGAALDNFAADGWQVIAFEPDKNNREKLSRVYGAYPNVTIDSRGISDHMDDNVPFYTSAESSGISGLLSFDQSHQSAGTISVTTLEQVLIEYEVREIDFLKIDTEGLDLSVLSGLPDSTTPKVIVCEFEDRKTLTLGYVYSDLADELVRRGYFVIMSEWHPLEKYGQRHKWRRAVEWPAKVLDKNAWGNFVAVSDKKLAKQILRAFP